MIPKLDEYKLKWSVDSVSEMKLGLDAMQQALQRLLHPEANLPIVHVAGTNGKGSTITFLEQIAQAHGLTVGKFMSPCIVDLHDQIQFNGQPIATEDVDTQFQKIKARGVSGMLTDFELLTCIAFLYFQQVKPDLVLLETGMGGLEDSTNVITPIASVIPSIALDHTAFLGTTIEDIAFHKAGIIKEGKPVIVGDLETDALTVIARIAQQKRAPLHKYGDEFFVTCNGEVETYTNVESKLEISRLDRQLPGEHQGDNMALAITTFVKTAPTLKTIVDMNKVRIGVHNAQLPGRFEEILPSIYLDGAHNPASAETLVQTIQQQFPNRPIRFVIGMLKDKDVSTVLSFYEQVSDEFYFVEIHNPRAMSAVELMNKSSAKQKRVIVDVATFMKETPFDGITFITGSLYLLAEIRNSLCNEIDGF